MRILVSPGERANIGASHFRGLSHVVVASFGPGNVFLFDLARRQVVGTVSEATAAEQMFWDRILLPIAVGVLGPAVGVLPVHCACLAMDGMGALIAGPSGVGKSTLAVALAQHGFDYLSDDWTYLRERDGRLLAHGMGVPAKLLPDAIRHFPLLANYAVGIALNQEPAYELPAEETGARVETSCEPRWLFFLQRSTERGCKIAPMAAAEARRYLERSVERLPVELGEMIQTRSSIIDRISSLPCWSLRYGGPPQVAAGALKKFFAKQQEMVLV